MHRSFALAVIVSALFVAACKRGQQGGGSSASDNTPPPPVAGAPIALQVGTPANVAVPAMPQMSLTITEEGEYTIDAMGNGMDPVMSLQGTSGELERADDVERGTNLDARITRTLSPGTYTILVYEYRGRAMSATVKVGRALPPPTAGVALLNVPVTVTTREGPDDRSAAVDVLFVCPRAGSYTITATTADSANDPKIEIFHNGTSIGSDDDGGGGRNARFTHRLEAGPHQIRVWDFHHRASPFVITVAD